MIGAKRTTAAAIVVLMLQVVATACGKGEDEAPKAACGLIDRDLVSQLADGREWHNFGTLYRDGRFTDGCEVISRHERLLLVVLIDFRGSVDALRARRTVLEERRRLLRTCPGSTPAPVTEHSVTTECLSDEKVYYVEWNPRRLVRLTIYRQPGLSVSRDDAVRITDDLNRRADELEK